jgi:hypothetical protein
MTTYERDAELLLKANQHILDRKFHEYKLAALTGLMVNWKIDFTETHADIVAEICDMVALAMERLDRAEGGS